MLVATSRRTGPWCWRGDPPGCPCRSWARRLPARGWPPSWPATAGRRRPTSVTRDLTTWPGLPWPRPTSPWSWVAPVGPSEPGRDGSWPPWCPLPTAAPSTLLPGSPTPTRRCAEVGTDSKVAERAEISGAQRVEGLDRFGALAPGAPVEVFSRFTRRWVTGFEIAEAGTDGNPPEIAALGFHAVAVDLRGHGDSGRLGGSGACWLAWNLDLALLIGYLGRPAGLVGHSMGGGQALSVAGAFPDLVTWVVCIDGLGPSFEGTGDADHGALVG